MRESKSDGTRDETRDRRRSGTKTSDRQETKDSTRQIKRDANRQEIGGRGGGRGEVGPTGRQDCSMGWFRGMDTQSLRPR